MTHAQTELSQKRCAATAAVHNKMIKAQGLVRTPHVQLPRNCQ